MQIQGMQQLLGTMNELMAQNSTQPVKENASTFASMFTQAVEQANQSQLDAERATHDFTLGLTEQSLSDVMVTLQKANISFQTVTQVRNHLVSAYQDIMNMSL